MNTDNQNIYAFEEEDTLNLREELDKYLHYWKWFVLGLTLSIAFSFYYLRKTTEKYAIEATIMIKNGKSGGDLMSEMSAFQDLGVFSDVKNSIDNEMEILRSRTLISGVIKELGLNIKYRREGRIKVREYYNNAPIKLNFLEGESVFYKTSATLKVNILSQTEFALENEKFGKLGNHKFGQQIKTPYGKIIITPRFTGKLPSNPEVIISIIPLDALANGYRGAVKIEPISKKASVISISLEDAIQQRAQDFINTLINKYNQDAIDDKNLVSKNTADFIENRLTIINGELNVVESDAASFKKRNKLTDIKSEADLFLNNVSDTKKQILDTNTQLRLADFMLNYLQQGKGDTKLLPTNLGLSDASIATLVAKYNELVLERNRILKSSSLQNPVVVLLDGQLLTLEQTLEQSLNNVKQSLQIILSDLNVQEKLIDAKITAIPQQEKEFRNIERQQQIKEALYLYLLQKREETAISLAVTAPNAKIIDAAFSNGTPVSPKKNIVLLAGLLIGLLIPFVIIYIRDLLDTKIHNRKDIEKQISVPVLGDIPADKSKDNIVMRGDIRSSTAEAFRLLRTNLDFLLANAEHKKAKTVFVTSTISGEGKTFIAINLASTLALSGKKVLLMGADLRAPKIIQYLGMVERKGVTNYIMDAKLKYSDLLFKVPDLEGLDFMSSGVVPPNPAELLLSPRVTQLFDEIKEKYDYIIVDTAPVNLVTDTLLLNKYADLFIYVTRANYLDKRLLVVPETLYKEKRLNNMTILINDSDHKKGYGYGYGYGYSKANQSWWQRFFKASEKFSDSLKRKS